MRIEKMGSKSDVVVKLVLVFFVTLLSFSIGTFVGKKYSDNQHELARLEPGHEDGHATREVASTEDAHGAAHGGGHGEAKTGSSTMSDEEIAKLAEEFVADEAESPAKALDHEVKTATTETKAGEHGKPAATGTKLAEQVKEEVKEEASHIANQLAAGHKPTEATTKKEAPKASDRIPSSLPKNVAQYTVGKFTVQVASYSEEGEAQKTASELKQKGYSAFYIPAKVDGKTWYRVSIGQFATQNEASDYRKEILTNAKVTSAIVQKISQ